MQADRQTYRHAYRNTSHPYGGGGVERQSNNKIQRRFAEQRCRRVQRLLQQTISSTDHRRRTSLTMAPAVGTWLRLCDHRCRFVFGIALRHETLTSGVSPRNVLNCSCQKIHFREHLQEHLQSFYDCFLLSLNNQTWWW